MLYQSLGGGGSLVEGGERDASVVERVLVARIADTCGVVSDYAAVVNADTLQPINTIGGRVLLAVAAKFGNTRSIDNVLLSVDPVVDGWGTGKSVRKKWLGSTKAILGWHALSPRRAWWGGGTPFADSGLVKKWGQAPAGHRYSSGFAWVGRSQSPFFHKLSGRATHV